MPFYLELVTVEQLCPQVPGPRLLDHAPGDAPCNILTPGAQEPAGHKGVGSSTRGEQGAKKQTRMEESRGTKEYAGGKSGTNVGIAQPLGCRGRGRVEVGGRTYKKFRIQSR